MSSDPSENDRRARILTAVLRLLSQSGISGVSIRAVAREAGVGLGLVNYYYTDKVGLISAALREVELQDLALLSPTPGLSPGAQVREVLRRVAEESFLSTEYLSLRLQLWSLAQAHEEYSRINTTAQARYRENLADLIRAARPRLSEPECAARAADVDVIQNGLWLTSLLGLDAAARQRAVALCEAIALAP